MRAIRLQTFTGLATLMISACSASRVHAPPVEPVAVPERLAKQSSPEVYLELPPGTDTDTADPGTNTSKGPADDVAGQPGAETDDTEPRNPTDPLVAAPETAPDQYEDGIPPVTDIPDGTPHAMVVASLQRVGRLRELDLSRTAIESLAPIDALDDLEVLVAYETAAQDLTPLSRMKSLRAIDLDATRVDDLRPLAGLQKLEVVELRGTEVRHLDPLTQTPALRKLDVSGTRVRSLRPLQHLTELRELDISHTDVRDLRHLAGAHRLQVLRLDGTRVRNLRVLEDLENLEELSFRDTPISDVRPLAKLKQLETIDLRNTRVSSDEVRALEKALPFTQVFSTAAADELRKDEHNGSTSD